MAGIRRRTAAAVGRLPRARAASTAQQHPGAVADADGRGATRRRDDAGLHLGHDRPAQGGDAHQRQRRVLRSQIAALRGPACPAAPPGPERPDRDLPPAVPRRRADLLDVAPGRRRRRCSTSPSRSTRSTQNLREVQPTLFFAVPRIWEKLHAGVMIKGNDATWLKRRCCGVRARRRRPDRHDQGRQRRRPHRRSRCSTRVGYLLVFRALKERLGLRRCRYAASGAAPIAPEVLEFFMGIGVPMLRALRDDREHRRRHRQLRRAG